MRYTYALLLACLIATHSSAQTNRTSSVVHSGVRAHTTVARTQLKVVAGVVEQGGVVRYLPRVQISVFPQKYADTESRATSVYTSELNRLRQTRDLKYKDITERRRAELEKAEEHYNQEVRTALATFTFDPATGIPGCVEYDSLLQRVELCTQYGVGQKIQLSSQLRNWIANPALVGHFDPQTFKADSTPYARDQTAALSAIPLSDYEQVPEFQNQIRKSVQKERSQAHLSSTAMLPDEVQRAAVARFVNDWAAAAGKRSYFGGNNLAKFGSISFDFITAAHKQLQQAVERALRQQTDKTLLEYVNAKDEINHRYDAEQAESDAEFQKYAKGAEDARADSLNAARRATPPVVTASTSLEGDALITLPPGAYVLYAEDTTTDHHYRWALPLPVRIRDHTIELTDANALKATAEDVASATAQPSYPKASALTATQQAEYSLRYGSRLLGSWNRICVSSNKTSPPDDRLLLTDSPLGFGFAVSCATDSVFNTLRMNDNDIAARIFRDYVAPYLSGIPADLKSTGGSQAFEAVTVKVLTSSKSFADEYAVGNFFWLDYVFRIADVESFAYQKIDAQQLLDRGHITNDRIGRITVKLVGAN